MEILTWVLHGSLVHQDSEDNSEVIYPDLAHRLSAGIGPTRCGSRPASGIQPGYGQHGLDNRLREEASSRSLRAWPSTTGTPPSGSITATLRLPQHGLTSVGAVGVGVGQLWWRL